MFVKEEEVVIIGAGAAGIGAGLALSRLGVPYLILEAKDRVGGRCYTDVETFGRPWDCGSHWFYSADINPLRVLADRLEHPYETQTTDWVSAIHSGGRWATPDEVTEARKYIAGEFGRITSETRDVSIGSLLEEEGRWAGLMRDRVAQLGANDPQNISALDYARFEDTNISYAVSGGFGALFEAMARGLPVRTECEVIRMDVRDNCVEVEARGDVLIRAGAAIVTVSTEVLRAGAIEFYPSLPSDLTDALEGISLGCSEKVALGLKSDPFGLSGASRIQLPVGEGEDARHAFFELLPNGKPLVIAHLGGDVAKGLVMDGEAAMVDFAVSALAAAYGSDIASQVVETAATSWLPDPHIRGGHSTVKPGMDGARARLRQPVAERIYIAGEATSDQHFSTCHGAYATGIEAAHEAAAMLGHWRADADPHWLPVFG